MSERHRLSTKVVCVVGTRPEVIKLAPVILQLKKHDAVEVDVLATGQHLELLDNAMKSFGITADHNLKVMTEGQQLSTLTSRLIEQLGVYFRKEMPDVTLVQGDTTTAMASGLACFYEGIEVGHVEAGLRTGSIYNPFPEEQNRILLSKLSKWHFCPTERSRLNLLQEGISRDVHVTGNTVIDALRITLAGQPVRSQIMGAEKRTILATIHRRESFGEPIRRILRALREIARRFDNVEIVLPVHPNPNVKTAVKEELEGISNIFLKNPLAYDEIVSMLKQCEFVITDSGGLQEEAPALGKPVLVVREMTERQEAIEHGVAELVGTDTNQIVESAAKLLTDKIAYSALAKGYSPYGDGYAAERIVRILGF